MEFLYVLIGIFVLTILLLASVVIPACRHRKKHPFMPQLQKAVYAHRGFHGPDAPENSLAAIKKAVEKGYGIEFDLHLTADNRLAVIHDGTLTRTCGVDLEVCSHSLEELRRHPLSNGEPIPSFEEVLALVDGRIPLLIELKPDGGNDARLVCACLESLKGYKGCFCIESFDPRVLVALKKQAPHVARGQLSCDYLHTRHLPFYQRFCFHTLLTNAVTNPDFVAYKYADRNKLPCRMARAAGIPLFYWTIREGSVALEEIGRGNAVIFEGFEL